MPAATCQELIPTDTLKHLQQLLTYLVDSSSVDSGSSFAQELAVWFAAGVYYPPPVSAFSGV